MQMDTSDLVTQGYLAVKQGEQDRAIQLFKSALQQNENNVGAWLGLARLAETKKERWRCIQRAEQIAPDDPRVQKAKLWAKNKDHTNAMPWQKAGLGCAGIVAMLFLILATLFFFNSYANDLAERDPVQLAELDGAFDPGIQDGLRDSLNDTAVSETVFEAIATSTPQLPEKNVALQDLRPTWTITPTPLPTATPTPTYAPTFVSEIYDRGVRPIGVGLDERWIDVDLTTQTLTAYEGDSPVFQRAISSGTWEYPTVTGQFRIWLTYESQTMDGTLLGFDYYLEDVPYVMYFYGDYAIHGTFWHNNFGTPTSHGCVNMSREDAGWLYNWAGLGTLVNVHH